MRQVISRAPMRVSFVGGGTDKREWFEKQSGAVISAAIQQYVYVSVRELPKIFDFRYRVVSSKIEQVNTLNEIEQPIVREALRIIGNPDDRLEILYNADLPGRSGMGSSSSFTVACIEALSSFYNKKLNKSEIADLAIKIERDILGEQGGLQDQIAASYGGFNKINFHKSGYEVNKIDFSSDQIHELEQIFFLVFTRFTRIASEIEKRKIKNINNFNVVHKEIFDQVDTFHKLITSKKLVPTKIGKLLSQNWELKKLLDNNVSNQALDDMYKLILESNIYGGKLLGAGSGGFFLFVKDKDKALPKYKLPKDFFTLPFNIDHAGACTIYRNL